MVCTEDAEPGGPGSNVPSYSSISAHRQSSISQLTILPSHSVAHVALVLFKMCLRPAPLMYGQGRSNTFCCLRQNANTSPSSNSRCVVLEEGQVKIPQSPLIVVLSLTLTKIPLLSLLDIQNKLSEELTTLCLMVGAAVSRMSLCLGAASSLFQSGVGLYGLKLNTGHTCPIPGATFKMLT